MATSSDAQQRDRLVILPIYAGHICGTSVWRNHLVGQNWEGGWPNLGSHRAALLLDGISLGGELFLQPLVVALKHLHCLLYLGLPQQRLSWTLLGRLMSSTAEIARACAREQDPVGGHLLGLGAVLGSLCFVCGCIQRGICVRQGHNLILQARQRVHTSFIIDKQHIELYYTSFRVTLWSVRWLHAPDIASLTSDWRCLLCRSSISASRCCRSLVRLRLSAVKASICK